ncbi:MAG: hypothetical protein AUH44_01775 [Chloroflexi bacterium 13_1_40CM_68_15]|nr:MAG: hypothetical protein AUH44_01775 [Chloroflexi bacterium 13_1_40CM_68_15]
MTQQVTDPVASKAVFDREIAEYRENEGEYRKLGWLLLEAEYPRVLVVMAAAHLLPAPVLFGLALDYTNYPVEPPALRFVDPFTGEEVPFDKLPNHLLRGEKLAMPAILAPQGMNAEAVVPRNELVLQHHGGPAILCHPGVREYHEHPAHTGDAWELHAGEGRLNRLLDIVYRFGIRPVQAQVQLTVVYPQTAPGI